MASGPPKTASEPAPMRLSIAIPIYNFAGFITETLDSIVAQDGADEVEIVVVDGASTDTTPQVMAEYQRAHPKVRYERLPAKGGVDRDIAIAFSKSTGDYCWLFSGDDIMRPGALRRALTEIESGCDVYLSTHMEYQPDLKGWGDWPVLAPATPDTFDLGDPADRARYFAAAVNTEAFFSFMAGTITKRAAWDRVPYNEAFDGSCFAQAARLFELMKGGLKLRFVGECWQDRRPDNDSFLGRGFVNRIALTVNGFTRIADTFFGHDSVEAFHVRRCLRREHTIGLLIQAKFMCMLDPELEKRATLDALVARAYSDATYENLRLRLKYRMTRPQSFRKWRPDEARAIEQAIAERKARRKAA